MNVELPPDQWRCCPACTMLDIVGGDHCRVCGCEMDAPQVVYAKPKVRANQPTGGIVDMEQGEDGVFRVKK